MFQFSVLIWLLPFSCCRAVLLFSCPAVVLFCCPVVLLSCCPAAFLSYCSLFFFLLLSCPLSSCPVVLLSYNLSVKRPVLALKAKAVIQQKRKCTKHRSCNAKDHTDLPKPTLCADICDFFRALSKSFLPSNSDRGSGGSHQTWLVSLEGCQISTYWPNCSPFTFSLFPGVKAVKGASGIREAA